jgi:isopentenyl diphosphate isomerase/L-lactate dehydrogenase-like FMN-dependent dehydrogenase
MAMPFLEASRISTEAVIDEIEVIKAALQTAMFCSGVSNIDELRGGSQFLQREEHNELFTS